MKHLIRFLTVVLLLLGCTSLVWLSTYNRQLSTEIARLEAELGKMEIKDDKAIYVAEIAQPEVPPEVAPHVEMVWQFRCYLPPNYDFLSTAGGGRVAANGLYQHGGYSSSWSMPKATAIHNLMTVSFQQKQKHMEVFYCFGGISGTTSWNEFKPEEFKGLVVQKLVSSRQGPRSFNQNSILPLLKMYDPSTAKVEQVAGQPLTTYSGGLLVICPKVHRTALEQLRGGEVPRDFDPDSLAAPVSDE